MADAMLIQQVVDGKRDLENEWDMAPLTAGFSNGDVNYDGATNATDVRIIMEYCAGLRALPEAPVDGNGNEYSQRFMYYHDDHLGSTGIVTDRCGQIVQQVTYTPYGEMRSELNLGASVNYLYTGKEFDREVGLYYYGARYYDQSIGRFITPDTVIPNPADSQSYNRYAYCLNNPISYNDPTGHEPVAPNPPPPPPPPPRPVAVPTVEVPPPPPPVVTQPAPAEVPPQQPQTSATPAEVPQNIKTDKSTEAPVEKDQIAPEMKCADTTKEQTKDYTETFDKQLQKTQEQFAAKAKEIDEKYAPMLDDALQRGDIDAWKALSNAKDTERLEAFRSLVTDKAQHDLKNNEDSPFTEKNMNGPYALYRGEKFAPNDFGNYNYGAAAKSFGLSLFTAKAGANINQIMKSGHLDTARSQGMIERGYNHAFK